MVPRVVISEPLDEVVVVARPPWEEADHRPDLWNRVGAVVAALHAVPAS